MKNKTIYMLTAIVFMVVSCLLSACGGTKTEDVKKSAGAVKPQALNVSVFIDLSDRLVRVMTPSQLSRDTAIVNHIADIFKAATVGPQILVSENHLKVFFSPAPADPRIANLADGLDVDMKKMKVANRRRELENMKAVFGKNLTQIYERTIATQKWPGCDIWDFFSSKKVDHLCIRPNARNIIVILTDGFLFDVNHKVKVGDKGYSYVLPETLKVPDSYLIPRRDGLGNLEVLMLEVNPYHPTQREPLVKVLEDWFGKMGVKKCLVFETALPADTRTVIDSFFE